MSSWKRSPPIAATAMFTIPMRGNELAITVDAVLGLVHVYNPHEG